MYQIWQSDMKIYEPNETVLLLSSTTSTKTIEEVVKNKQEKYYQ